MGSQWFSDFFLAHNLLTRTLGFTITGAACKRGSNILADSLKIFLLVSADSSNLTGAKLMVSKSEEYLYPKTLSLSHPCVIYRSSFSITCLRFSLLVLQERSSK